MTKRRKVVVVDGSNLATEGRSVPSLKQLDEAVRAFLADEPDAEMIVVVDATFGHRIDASERARFKEAELDGDLVVPPAGAIGRGDAFILKIAKRADAMVLSNDSFQEFHAEHPWLFDEDRLVGGKPVAGVGWIFTARNPVRGPTSRAVRSKAAKQTAEAAPVAASATRPRRAPAPAAEAAPAAPPARRARGAKKQAQTSAVAKEAAAPRTATRRAQAASPTKSRASAAAVAARPTARTKDALTAAKKAAAPEATASKGRLEPANTTRSYQTLVRDHPIGDVVQGEVVQFTSHGAMVAIGVGRTMKVVCYAPLAGLGSPAPTRARDVLKKGDVRPFRVVALDPTRRRAELALA